MKGPVKRTILIETGDSIPEGVIDNLKIPAGEDLVVKTNRKSRNLGKATVDVGEDTIEVNVERRVNHPWESSGAGTHDECGCARGKVALIEMDCAILPRIGERN